MNIPARPTLLVVEEDPADLFLLKELLSEPGTGVFTILEAGRVTEALQIMEREQVDLVLLDLGLPDSSGLDALRKVRKAAPRIPVMVLTGMDNEELALAVLREGASDCVVKGAEEGRSLRRAVRMSLERAELLERVERHHEGMRERDARLEALAATATDAVISADELGNIIFWNHGAEVTFGYTAEEVFGQPLTLIMDQGDGARHREGYSAFIRSERLSSSLPGVQKFEGLRSDGRRVPVEVALSTWHEGGAKRVTAIVRDVTDRRAAEAAIEVLSRQYELLLETAGQGIIGIDADGTVSFANPAALELTGWTVADLLGRDVHEAIHHTSGDGQPLSASDCPLPVCLRDGLEVREESVFWRADGSRFTVSASYRPIIEAGAVTGVVLVFDDISERRRLEEQLRQAQKMEILGTLSGGIAHDFNNELSVIVLNAALAEDELEAGEPVSVDNLLEIKEAAARATRITRQLLNFSRQAPLALREEDLGGIVEHLGSMLGKLLPESIRLHIRCPDQPLVARVDRGVVEQAVLNLATNARDAMPTGGELELCVDRWLDDPDSPPVEGQEAGEYHCISVSDTGFGMDEATRERALQPFFTTKGVGKGTGLGLSMVFGLTRQLGGFLAIDSEPGEGTSVRLCLPAVTKGAACSVEDGERGAPIEGRGARVLLVEDEAALRDVSRRMLERHGYTVIPAKNGLEALELFEADAAGVDVVLSDLVMPDMGGMELYEELMQRHGHVPFVLTTGYSDQGESERGELRVVPKPWTVEVLLEALHEELTRESPVTQGR